MKIKEREWRDAGLGGGHFVVRVRKLKDKEEAPEGAISMPDDATEYDWTPEHQVKEGA